MPGMKAGIVAPVTAHMVDTDYYDIDIDSSFSGFCCHHSYCHLCHHHLHLRFYYYQLMCL